MTRKVVPFFLISLVVVAIALVVWRTTNAPPGDKAKGKRPNQSLVVEMAAVRVQPVPLSLQTVGQVQSEHSVQIRPQVSGLLQEVYFTEGQTVSKGQRLFRIDSAPYESALAGARAAWESAKAQAERLEPLAGKEYVTTQEYDNARAAAGQLRAMLTQAEINLAYTNIRAPIGGRTGSLAVRAGNLVSPSEAAPLVVINQMKPILVQYSIPQQRLAELRRYQSERSVRVFITREDGNGELSQGELVFVDNAVNAETGTIMLKARLTNEREQLWPGQFVGVRMQLAMQDDALVVPLTAVQVGQNGNFVYVVEQGKAVARPVQVDRQVNDLAVIADGLQAGEQVVTRAPRNLRPGSIIATGGEAEKAVSKQEAK